ncbi:hypothetical protein Golob_014610 [Gossypium lobatum]|uniref:RNase H type-1 domain-containing protein n=1 Tax=Gossypium lobatum TaxID=34289 RepID=A0A7J8LYL3_9ROSI|nr:hypothetical protein [Gossypium lobatum]
MFGWPFTMDALLMMHSGVLRIGFPGCLIVTLCIKRIEIAMVFWALCRVTLPVSLVFVVETLAVLHMLRFVVDLGFQFVVLECDARTIVQMLQAESDDFFEISSLIWEVKGLSQLFLECRFAFLERSRNRTAYAVAEEGMSRLKDRF